jgi:hypothetical protein
MTKHSDTTFAFAAQSYAEHINFPWCVEFLERRGKEQFGEKFIIRRSDYDVIYKLLVYFIGDKDEAARLGLASDKGLLLTGPVGCGKTSLMSLMRFVPPPERNHIVKSCRDISFDFIRDGYDVIARYSRLSFHNQQPKIYCFDDLGCEQAFKYFGNECNVLAEILLSRYDYFISEGMITHVTTNLSATELEKIYGNRLRSRMRQMFNLVSFDSKDKRH